jgi:hypothetical protein
MEYNERTKWLKKPLLYEYVGLKDIAIKGCKYKIPNTVIVYTTPDSFIEAYSPVSPLAKAFRNIAENNGKRYGAKKYKVIYNLNKKDEELFKNLWKTDGIFAFTFAGHGGEWEGKWYGYKIDAETSVGPDQVSPPYKLQAIGAYTCGSADQVMANGLPANSPPMISWRYHVSESGTFVGYHGSVNWINVWSNQEAINPGDIPE